MFLDDGDVELGRRYLTDGIVIAPAADALALEQLRFRLVELAATWLGVRVPSPELAGEWLDHIHHLVTSQTVNDLRLRLMTAMAEEAAIRRCIFAIARPWLEALVGNELAMQLRPNLSVQLPADADSALPLHADTWSGHSPFETVVWIPLVDCWGTKSMYLVPPAAAEQMWERYAARRGRTTIDLFDSVVDDLRWVEVAYGNVVLFDHSLPHGNQTNGEDTTRWSVNCRFTGLFTPYADKGLGDFFLPITMRAVTQGALGHRSVGDW